ncbi:uncharacterized protein KY384_003336 [Bacidia gigantensis]|uniref:uncharacterized protein n=1 Tax=Bacidia gigantensis TaxID=2732470 RepID=UPI001D043A69|nr:uncharacterized protein KY384_003336 [Bacidia gigantensis]KAG8531704.1 hypothetical protein KY384_003336 [Bacidia gigantensis]
MADSQQTISLPSIVLLTAVSFFAVRYFFFPSSPNSSTGSRSQRSRQADPNDVERIATMFPQVSRRDIMWDLQRNGGTVAATTERILSVGALDTVGTLDLEHVIYLLTSLSPQPPQSFQPVIPNASSSSSGSSSQTKPEYMDLIKRYNLSDKVSTAPSPVGDSASSKQQTWSQDKKERQSMFQKRREDMILAARRKMEEKERNDAT